MNSRRVWIVALLLAGCRDIGTGGTGEVVVPPETLRQIQVSQPTDFAATQPTTAPSTLPTTQPASAQMQTVPLALAEARKLALQNNLDLKVELVNPSLALQSLNQEEARYEALFTTDAGYSSTDQPFANALSEQLQGSQSQSWSLNPGVQVPLRTGGVLSVNVPMSRFSNDSAAELLNPSYTSDLTATFSQPLLRGGGIDVNAQPIRVAFYGYEQQQARTKLEVIRVLADVDRTYWRLYAAREAVDVRKQEYDLAVAQLDRAKRMVRAGTVADVELVRAQSGVADRVEGIITAQNLVATNQRDLQRMLNTSGMDMGSAVTIVPSTKPNSRYLAIDEPHLVNKAMSGRMELLDQELQIAEDTAAVRVARHEMLPLVSLQYTYNISGLGGNLDQSFTMVRDNRFDDHTVGVHVEVPIGNEAARSRLRVALLSRIQALATKEQREAQVHEDVLNASDEITTDWQRILAARERVRLAQRLLDVEIRSFEQGLRTSTEVLDAQTSLADAQLSEISAVSDYQIAQIDLAFATGTLLGESQVIWDATLPGK